MDTINADKNYSFRSAIARLVFCIFLSGCSVSVEDQQRDTGGAIHGALTGAGAGVVTAFQVAAPTGPGAFIGAGFGAVAGGVTGAIENQKEGDVAKMQHQTDVLKYRTEIQALLEKHYQKRLELHPTRDIFPADLFFEADTAKLSKKGDALTHELALLNKERLPWSRLVIASYVKSSSENNEFADYLARRRAVILGDAFVHYGIEPRRIETRPVTISSSIVKDPESAPFRYAQAIELIVADR